MGARTRQGGPNLVWFGVLLIVWMVLVAVGSQIPGAQWLAERVPAPVAFAILLMVPASLVCISVIAWMWRAHLNPTRWAVLLVNAVFLLSTILVVPLLRYNLSVRLVGEWLAWPALIALVATLVLALVKQRMGQGHSITLPSWLTPNRTRYAAICATKEGRLREAVALFDEHLGTKAKDWEALCSLGECHQALGDLNAAESAFRQSLDVNPKSAEARAGLALVHAERDHDWNAAIQTIEEHLPDATKLGVAAFTELELAWVYHLKGDPETARGHFERAIHEIDNWEQIGVEEDAQLAGDEYRAGVLCHALKSDSGSALRHLQKAVQLSPESVYARQAKGLIDTISREQQPRTA